MDRRSRLARYGWRRALVHAGLAFVLVGAAPAKPVAPAKLVWAFGDSLVAGYGLLPAQGFTAQLQAALRQRGIAATVRNGGVAGDTAAQGLARLRWGLRGLGTAPDLVIVELGANDMLRGLPPAQVRDHLNAILTELGRRHIPVLLVGMRAAPNLGADYGRAFDGLYPALARAHHVPLYPFFLDGVTTHRALVQADGLHPNPIGVAVIVKRMLPLMMGQLRSPRP